MTISPSEHAEEPPAQQATPVPAIEPQAGIDAAMAALATLATAPVGEHAEAFDRVHTALTEALSAVDGV